MNPYVRSPKLDEPTEKWGSGADRLSRTIDAAIDQRKLYYGAISERAKMRNGLPLVLIPLSAATLYRGVTTTTDAGREMVLKMGLLGAALYGTSTYYTVSAKEKIYLAGVDALSCSIHAVEPFLVSGPDGKELDQALKDLEAAIRNVEVARRDVEDTRRVAEASERLADLDRDPLYIQQYLNGRDLLANAREVANAGRLLQGQIQVAARNLRRAVERIVKQVNDQIEASEPDPSSILRLSAGLGNVAGQIAHVPSAAFEAKPIGSARSGGPAFNSFMAALNRLTTANGKLVEARDKVQSLTALATALTKQASSVDDCVVATVASELRVEPNVDTLEMRPGETRQFTAYGQAPQAELVGLVRGAGKTKDAVQLTVQEQQQSRVRFRLAYDEAQEGVTTVSLQVASGERTPAARKTITVNLRPVEQKKEEPAPTPKPKIAEKGKGAAKGAKPAAKEGEKGVTPTAPEPSKVAPTPAPAPVPPVDDKKAGPPNTGAMNEFERSLGEEEIRNIQRKLLGADKTTSGRFDAETRAAIRRLQEVRKAKGSQANIDGQLTPVLAKAIREM